MSAQRIQTADVIAIRHLDTVGLLKLRSNRPGEGTLDCLERVTPLRVRPRPPEPNPSDVVDVHAPPTGAGRGRLGTLALGLILGVALGQLGELVAIALRHH